MRVFVCAGSLAFAAACSSGAPAREQGFTSVAVTLGDDGSDPNASDTDDDARETDDDDDGLTTDADSGDESGSDSDPQPGHDQEPTPITATASTAPCHALDPDASVDLLDGDASTTFVAAGNSIWIRFDAEAPHELDTYAITSAVDRPERDPIRWFLLGSNDGTQWVELDIRLHEDFGNRSERREFEVATSEAYAFFLLRTENASGGELQIAEVELHGRSALDDDSTEPPATATALTATAVSRTQIDLAWQGTADTHKIERSEDGTAFTTIGYTTRGTASFSVRDLAPSTPAYFRVVAQNGSGDAAPSEPATATTLPVFGIPGQDGWLYSEGGYSLTVAYVGIPAVDPAAYDRLVDEFFVTYPTMAAAYNPDAPKHIRLTFDPAYDGVAAAGGTDITVSPIYFAQHQADTDVVVHEAFHLVQAYSFGEVPGWATEGLADYARFTYGNFNPNSCWTMQRYADGQHYTDAYGVTARFFLWIATEISPGLPQRLDDTLRAGTYDDDFWITETGESIDALWNAYASAPDHAPVLYE